MAQDVDFVTSLGRPFLAHRLRRIAETFLEGYSRWLPSVGVTAPARSLSTLLLLETSGPMGVTELAARLQLSHPLVIKLVESLEAQGFTAIERDPQDGRRRPVVLTDAGRDQAAKVRDAIAILDRSYSDLSREIGLDLLDAVKRIETACLQLRFEDRLNTATVETMKEVDVPCA